MKVLLAADNSIYSRAALDQVLSCPWKDTQFLVLGVAETYHPRMDYWNPHSSELLKEHEAKIHSEHEEVAKSFAKELADRFPDASIETKVVEGHVVDVILAVAAEWQTELIVLGSHGRKGFDRFLLGSVSEAVASHSPVSVRIVRLPPGK